MCRIMKVCVKDGRLRPGTNTEPYVDHHTQEKDSGTCNERTPLGPAQNVPTLQVASYERYDSVAGTTGVEVAATGLPCSSHINTVHHANERGSSTTEIAERRPTALPDSLSHHPYDFTNSVGSAQWTVLDLLMHRKPGRVDVILDEELCDGRVDVILDEELCDGERVCDSPGPLSYSDVFVVKAKYPAT
ncbi:uncharacterized protein [Littorina saxatilis]